MTVSINSNIVGGGGLGLTAAQAAAGATGVIASDSSGVAYKQDGTTFTAGGASTWGSITGTLSSQTDLNTALAGKLPTSAIATTTSLLAGDGAGNAVAASSTSVGQPMQATITQPYGIAPSGATIGANGGALTLTTAFIETYGPTGGIPYDGIWLWFEAGATDTGSSAGFYWTVMTSTTAGTVYNNYLAPGSSALNKPPTTPTLYTTNAGKVGTTGTTSQILGWTIPTSIPAGTLGANGHVDLEMSLRCNNSAGTKTLQPKWAGSNLGPTLVNATTSTNGELTLRYFNKNNAARQGSGVVCAYPSATLSTQLPTGATQNTATTATSVGVDLKLGTSTDWVVCQFAAVKIWPSA